MFILYLSAVAVAIILRRQERRHRAEATIAYGRLGQPIPPREPKLGKYECWLALAVGTFLAIIGVMTVVANFVMSKDNIQVPSGQWESAAVFLAAGITIYVLGVRSLQENRRYALELREKEKA